MSEKSEIEQAFVKLNPHSDDIVIVNTNVVPAESMMEALKHVAPTGKLTVLFVDLDPGAKMPEAFYTMSQENARKIFDEIFGAKSIQ